MSVKTPVLFPGFAMAVLIVGIAHATPIVWLLFGNILASGTTNEEMIQRVQVPLPAVPGANDDDQEAWTAKLIPAAQPACSYKM